MFPCRTARDIDGVCSIWVWMFSISTVASSTRMPMARASPPKVMMLIVLPGQVQGDDRPQQCQRNVQHDDDHTAQVAQEEQDHQAGQPGPQAPSTPTLSMAR